MKRSTALALVLGLATGLPALAGNIEAGKLKSDACTDCHGDNGKGDEENPAIAGMPIEKFINAMKEYQAETRTKSKKMIKSAKKVNDEDIADLAEYYSSLK